MGNFCGHDVQKRKEKDLDGLRITNDCFVSFLQGKKRTMLFLSHEQRLLVLSGVCHTYDHIK